MELADLNNTIDQMHPTDMYRTFCPMVFKYTLFSSKLGTFFSIDHMFSHEISSNKYEIIEIIYKHLLLSTQWYKIEINNRGELTNLQICGN